ncbi:M23 family metallopeptidase [Desulfovibrio subterraneus]|jgi:murein DD-endopeptidase MepM/ murein hydrolase activator NlpD|uniref:M23 family metallopeptidase n=1 Tax=Desulfovibrio subterraneus TaxID=2718620 RepID=UPI00157B5F90|nr:M23 family metallopeptidase [Desulfovibrio subterraneus]WBF66483.1 M23 family metallopeptidase [Desulfovibrio subterraneus]
MLFSKYHIVIFRENEGHCKKLFLRGWLCVLVFGIFLTFAAGNVVFWKYYTSYQKLSQEYASAEKTVEEQNNQILSMANKLKSVQNDLQRIQQFDSKLRVMINLDKDQGDTAAAMGGSRSKDFSESYLPIHRQELLARKMHSFLNQLNTEVRLEEVQQQELMQRFRENRELLASTPSIWPTEGWVSSPFGMRRSPFTGRREFHKGIDITNRKGTPIYSSAKGVVSFAGVDGGYGNVVVVSHGDGIDTRFAHMQRFVVKAGQSVTRGELIGYMGNTGRSTGPHLHYEVRVSGVCVNPMRYILN